MAHRLPTSRDGWPTGFCVVMVLSMLVGVVIGAISSRVFPPDVVVAKEFRLVDENGHSIGKLSYSQGTGRAVLGLRTPDNSQVAYYASDGFDVLYPNGDGAMCMSLLGGEPTILLNEHGGDGGWIACSDQPSAWVPSSGGGGGYGASKSW